MIDTIAMTDATPITIPSVVRKLRKLWTNDAGPRAHLRWPRTTAENGTPATCRLRRFCSVLAAVALIAPVLHDFAVLEPHDSLTVRGHIRLVRHDDDRLSVAVQLIEQRENLDARLRIEIARRLVGQQDRRIRDQRTRDRHALPLPARKLVGQVVSALRQTDPLQHALGLGLALPEAQATIDQRLHDVLERRCARQQVEALEDEADLLIADVGELVFVEPVHVALIEHVTSTGRRIETADDVHQRRLARARRADEHDLLVVIDREIKCVDGLDELLAHLVMLADR